MRDKDLYTQILGINPPWKVIDVELSVESAGTTLLGNWVITLDPVFSGLAWAVIFGILTSTLFTLIVIPVVYWMLYRKGEANLERQPLL